MYKKIEEKRYPQDLINEAFSFFLKPPPDSKIPKKQQDNAHAIRFVSTFNDIVIFVIQLPWGGNHSPTNEYVPHPSI